MRSPQKDSRLWTVALGAAGSLIAAKILQWFPTVVSVAVIAVGVGLVALGATAWWVRAPSRTRLRLAIAALAIALPALVLVGSRAVRHERQPFGAVFFRVTDVTRDPQFEYAADDAAHAVVVHPADVVRFRASISNLGLAPLEDIHLFSVVPPGLTLVSNPMTRAIITDFHPIKGDKFSYFTITTVVDADAHGIIQNVACFAAQQHDQGCDTATVRVQTP